MELLNNGHCMNSVCEVVDRLREEQNNTNTPSHPRQLDWKLNFCTTQLCEFCSVVCRIWKLGDWTTFYP